MAGQFRRHAGNADGSWGAVNTNTLRAIVDVPLRQMVQDAALIGVPCER